jgi:hypothetical protein
MKKNCQNSKKKKKKLIAVSRCEIRSYGGAAGPRLPKSLLTKGFRFFERYLVGFAVFINSMNVGLRDISYHRIFARDFNFPTYRNQ